MRSPIMVRLYLRGKAESGKQPRYIIGPLNRRDADTLLRLVRRNADAFRVAGFGWAVKSMHEDDMSLPANHVGVEDI